MTTYLDCQAEAYERSRSMKTVLIDAPGHSIVVLQRRVFLFGIPLWWEDTHVHRPMWTMDDAIKYALSSLPKGAYRAIERLV